MKSFFGCTITCITIISLSQASLRHNLHNDQCFQNSQVFVISVIHTETKIIVHQPISEISSLARIANKRICCQGVNHLYTYKSYQMKGIRYW